jgi:hypothetical protein
MHADVAETGSAAFAYAPTLLTFALTPRSSPQ